MEKRTIRVFLDSNVIISGLISERGAPRLVLDVLRLGLPALQGVTGRYNLTEIERNVARKVPAALPTLAEYLPKLGLEIVPVPFPGELIPFRGLVDDKDTPVLASAVMGHADFFLTGDMSLLDRIKSHSGIAFRAFAPREFLEDALPGLLAEAGRK